MRPLEAVVLLGVLVALGALVVGLRTPIRVARYAGLGAVVLSVVQALVEGPRWQMVPAYALGVVLAIALPARPRRSRIAAAGVLSLGLVWLAIAAALPILVPVFHFPQPSGPYGIGTVTYYWVDSTRPEVFTPDPRDHRALMVQVWYPAERGGAGRAPYVEHPETLAPLAHLLRLPGFVFGHFKYVATNAIPSAPALGGRHPVLIFVHGRGGFRQHNTQQVEHLVSHGYVVAAMDQPGAASGVIFPDGRLAPFDPRMFDPQHPGHPAFLDSVMSYLAADASFTLDELGAINRTDPKGLLTGRLDVAHAGIFGLSLGGAVAAEACRRDERFRACLAMDVFMPADVVASGLRQPAMWISRDARSMQREGWAQRDIDETQSSMRAVFAALPSDGYMVLIPGAFHANFSDLPLYSPLAGRLGITGPVDARRVHGIVDAYSLAFFGRYLRGEAAPLLASSVSPFQGVAFEARHP